MIRQSRLIVIAASLLALALAPGCGAEAADLADASVSPDADGEATVDAGLDVDAGSAPAATLRVLTYNIKHAELSSLAAIAQTIRESGADIVALQEVDKEAERSGGEFQALRLGQLTGMAASFRLAIVLPDGGQFGLALLSRYPILTSRKINLTSVGEQRVAVSWTIDLGAGGLVEITNTHLGLNASERTTQAAELVAFARESGAPVVIAGDLNETDKGAAYLRVSADFVDVWPTAGDGGAGATAPAPNPTSRIDYLFIDEDLGPALKAAVLDSDASDHLPVLATLTMPAGD